MWIKVEQGNKITENPQSEWRNDLLNKYASIMCWWYFLHLWRKLQNILFLNVVLRCFEISYSPKVNFNFFKNKLGGIKVNYTQQNTYSTILSYTIMLKLFRYLGISIWRNLRKIGIWDTMIEKMKRRLMRWKGRHLTFAGNVFLIKYVILTLPLFFISFFKT